MGLSLATLPLSLRAAEPASISATQEALVDYYEGIDQPLVEAAAWTARGMFNIGVHYMGSSEHGLARDACKVLARHGMTQGQRVRVIDINTMGADPKRWEVIGEAQCR